MIGLQNKTRYISSTFKGAPQVLNEYGTLVSLLDTVLCKGFNEVPIVSTELLGGNIVKVYLNVDHGFLLEQVVRITGADQSYFNADYRVLSKGLTFITIGLDPNITVASNITSAAQNLKIKTAPLGYSNVYTNAAKDTMCFKNKSDNNRGILKVIDKIPGYSYGATWAKFARVVMGKYIDGDGNFIDNKKAPYNIEFPDAENTGNKVSGSSGIHGYAKWNYAWGNYTHGREDQGTYGTFPRTWELIGDDNTFYLLMGVRDVGVDICVHGFGNIYSGDEISDLVLQSRDGFIGASSYRHSSRYGKESTSWGNITTENYGNFIYSDVTGSFSYDTRRYYCSGLYVGDSNKDRPWYSTDIKGYNNFSGEIVTSKLGIIDDAGHHRGHHRGLNILYGVDRPASGRLKETPYLILDVTDYLRGTMPLMFTLEDWEEVL